MNKSATVNETRTLLLDPKQSGQKINRLAYQVYEDNASEKEIVIAGIVKNGFMLAEKIASALEKISSIRVILCEVHINKHSQGNTEATISLDSAKLQGKVIVLVDDVLNSGKTLMYSLRPFLAADIKKIRTVLLIDRNHKRFPVAADFTGLSLSTTLQEHIEVEFTKDGASAWLM